MELDTDCEKRLFDLFDINQTTVQELFPGLNDGTDFKDELSNDISKLCLKRKMHFLIRQTFSQITFVEVPLEIPQV